MRSLPTKAVTSILDLAIATSSSDFSTQMRMAMAFLMEVDFHPEFPPRPGTLVNHALTVVNMWLLNWIKAP